MSPSLIAGSAIYTALKGIRHENSNSGTSLAALADVSLEELETMSSSIEQVISKELAGIQQTMDRSSSTMTKNGGLGSSGTFPVPMTGSQPPPSQGKNSCHSSSTSLTPTDVQDIFC